MCISDESPVENQGTTLYCVADYDYEQAVALKMGAELANLEEFDESAKVLYVAVTLTREVFYYLTDLAEEDSGSGAMALSWKRPTGRRASPIRGVAQKKTVPPLTTRTSRAGLISLVTRERALSASFHAR